MPAPLICRCGAKLNVLALCLFLVLGCGPVRENSIDKADKLYAEGKEAEAVALYKTNPEEVMRRGGGGAERMRRIVDHEARQGNEREARRWADLALENGLDIECESTDGVVVVTRVKRERAEKAAREQAEREAQEQARREAEAQEQTRREAEERERAAQQAPREALPDKVVKQGDLQVEIAEASIGKVPLKNLGRDATSKDELLMVRLDLLNTNPTKKVEYYSWTGKDISFDHDYATLKDNFGNSYKRVGFGLGSYPVGAVRGSESIYPNKSVTDVLVFELPVDTVTHLDLELPARNYGCDGLIRFRIPMKVIVGTKQHREAEAEAQAKAAQEKAAQEKAAQEREAAVDAALSKNAEGRGGVQEYLNGLYPDGVRRKPGERVPLSVLRAVAGRSRTEAEKMMDNDKEVSGNAIVRTYVHDFIVDAPNGKRPALPKDPDDFKLVLKMLNRIEVRAWYWTELEYVTERDRQGK